MALPTKIKTWQYDVNQTIYDSSIENCIDYEFIAIKNSLKGFGSNPWTVWKSSDGTTADSTDRWNTPANIVHGSGSHSWIVLTNPNGWQICIDFNQAAVQSCAIVWSATGAFSGGTISARPVASDEYVLVNGAVQPGNSATTKLHVMHSTDGYCSRIIRCYNNYVQFYLAVEKPYDQVSGWANTVAFCRFNTSAILTYASYNDAANCFTRIGTSNMTLYCTSEGLISSMVGELLNAPDDDTGEWILCPMGLASTTGIHRGRKGALYDLWWGNTAAAIGTTFPDDATKQFVQFDHFVFPWNGTTPQTA